MTITNMMLLIGNADDDIYGDAEMIVFILTHWYETTCFIKITINDVADWQF